MCDKHFLQAYSVVTDRVPQNWVSGFGSAVEKWVEGKVNTDFLHFLTNYVFGIFDDYSKWHSETLKIPQLAKSCC